MLATVLEKREGRWKIAKHFKTKEEAQWYIEERNQIPDSPDHPGYGVRYQTKIINTCAKGKKKQIRRENRAG